MLLVSLHQSKNNEASRFIRSCSECGGIDYHHAMVTSMNIFELIFIAGLMALSSVGVLAASAIPDAEGLPPQTPGTPVFISSGDSEAGQDNGVAVDTSGEIMMVWEETNKVLTKRYRSKIIGKSSEEGWSASTEIMIPPLTEPVATRVVSVAPGYMLAFWTARDRRQDIPGGWPYAVWSASYAKGQWSAAIPVSKTLPVAALAGKSPAGQAPTGVSTHHERLAVSTGKDAASGKAIAVWQEWWCVGACITSVKLSRIMSATYNAEKGWSTPIQVNNDSTPTPEEPEVSIDQQGRAVAVWRQRYDRSGTKVSADSEGLWIQRLHYSVLQPGSTRWAAPHLVEGITPTANVSKAAISSNAAGDAMIAWAEKKGRKGSDTQENCEVVMATRLVKTDLSWESPKAVSKPAGDFACDIVGFNMALDTAGNALVGWTASVQPERDHVAYAPAGQPWRAQLPLPYSNSGKTSQLRIAFVSPGRAVVVGTYVKHGQDRRSMRSHIVTHHFDASKMDTATTSKADPSQAWTASQRIDWPKGASAQQPTLAIHPNGQAISTWRQMIPGKAGISAYTWNTNTAKAP